MMDGVEQFGSTNLYTIFSCTNYGGTSKNYAGLLHYHFRTKNVKALTLKPEEGSTHWFDLSSLS